MAGFTQGNPLTAGAIPGLGAATPTTDSALRATLSALHPQDVYGKTPSGGVMSILNQTGGVIFPYTPQIQFSQAVNYMDVQLVHSNTDYSAYTRTPSVTITVTGKFTVQNQQEGQYAMAVIHFLRTVSKSYFGETDPNAGLPPPVLLFSAYGKYVFNQLRVILKNHSWSFEDSMDTISVNINGAPVRLPAMFSITTELMVVQTPQRMRTKFNFDAFASGALMNQGGWI